MTQASPGPTRYVVYPDKEGRASVPTDRPYVKYVKHDDVLHGKYDDVRYGPLPDPKIIDQSPENKPPSKPDNTSPSKPDNAPQSRPGILKPSKPGSASPSSARSAPSKQSTRTEDEREPKENPLDVCIVCICCLLFLLLLLICLLLVWERLYCVVVTPSTLRPDLLLFTEDTQPTVTRFIFQYERLKRLNFTDAAVACENLQSHLAFPLAEAQEAEIEYELEQILNDDKDNINETCNGFEFFIGLRRNRELQYQSIEGLISIIEPPLVDEEHDFVGDLCVKMDINKEGDEPANGSLHNVNCDSGDNWDCILCEYGCFDRSCFYATVKLEDGVSSSYPEAALNCREKTTGSLANVYHESIMQLIVDEISNESDNSSCSSMLIGNKRSIFFEDIYENPLLYITNKIDYADKGEHDVCVTINAENEPYRWTLNKCYDEFCFLCYTN